MNNKIKYQVAGGVILIIVGIALLLINYVSDKRDLAFSTMNLELSNVNNNVLEDEEVIDDNDEIVTEDGNTTSLVEKDIYVYESYLGEIEIPKINLRKGFYDKKSSLNNVKFNLYVMPTSKYPDVEGGNLIIAGHSGNYSNSYFKNLYLLEEGDNINIYYDNVNYVYKINKIYLQDKNGIVNVYRNLENTTLTLITCTYNDDNHQTVYIAYLVDKS